MAELTKEHKQAMAEGREQARAIREYLDALNWTARPGLPGDVEGVTATIEDLTERITDESDPLRKVELVQRQLDMDEYLEELKSRPDQEDAEAGFIQAVKPYSERKGLSYDAWRKLGVPARVLHEADMPRGWKPEGGE